MDVLKKSWSYFKPYKKTVLICYAASMLIVILNMVNPKITGIVFDKIFSENSSADIRYVVILLGIMILVTLIKHVITYIKARTLEKASMIVMNKIRHDTMKKFFSMSFETFNKSKTGNIMTTLSTDVENVKSIFSGIIPVIFESVFSFIVASVILFSMNWKLSLACYAILPFIYISVKKYSVQTRPIFVNIREQSARLSNVAQENINGVRQVRAFAREDYEIEKMDKANKAYKKSRLDYVPVWARNHSKVFMLTNLTYIITIGFGGILVCYNEISLGEMVSFTGYITYLMNPLNLVPTYITNLQTSLVSGTKVMELLNKKPRISSSEACCVPEEWDIEFKNVSLSYDGNTALENINISIPFGSKIGIVGATSSGKSSLVNMIPRFYDPTEGEILIGGISLKQCDLHNLRKNISMVMQDVFLFSDTIKENISYSCDEEIPEAEILKAAKNACADEFISQMPEGFETIVGERGVGLSGGQKQRISMARAFLKPAKILIMDDSTSALDNKTEKKTLENITRLDEQKTIIVIASRISSVKDSDIILFMDHGKITEQGTHDELMAINGEYAKVFNQQSAK